MVAGVLVFLFGGVFSGFSANEKKTDEQLIQGTWVCVLAKTDDKGRDEISIGSSIKVAGNKADVIRKNGTLEVTVYFTLNPKKMPKEIDFYHFEGGGLLRKKINILGIYAFKDNKLWICRSSPDAPRPTSFDMAGGPGELRVLIYRRQKE